MDDAVEATEIDPNDPDLVSESLETDANADAYERTPTLPDGKWRAKMKLIDIKYPNGPNKGKVVPEKFLTTIATWRTPPKKFLCVNLESDVLDTGTSTHGRYNGSKLSDYWVKTLVDDRKPGASALATVIRKSGGQVPVGTPQTGVKDIALRHFAGEPEVVIETQWEARCQKCEEKADKEGRDKPKPFKRGMHNFPMKRVAPGQPASPVDKYDPEIQCPDCKTQVRAMPRIVQYFEVSTPVTFK
jgi:hypothetical protein